MNETDEVRRHSCTRLEHDFYETFPLKNINNKKSKEKRKRRR